MVRQKNEKHVWMGENWYCYDARLLHLSRFFLFFFANGSITDISAYRSSRWNASSIASTVYRCFWDTSKCFLLHFDWGIHFQSGHLRACYKEWWCNITQVIFIIMHFIINSNYNKSIKKCTITWYIWTFYKFISINFVSFLIIRNNKVTHIFISFQNVVKMYIL